ncbi:MAG: Crp/Fnr family transcriptional regulator [Bacteroidota bacterium]|nr:Crp/Fnr family transcriptional regulator [Bacteroidota bacterium]
MQNTITPRPFDCTTCLFRNVVCHYITEQEFDLLYKNSIQLKFKKNEYIMKQGSKSTHIVYLSKGRVKMNFETNSGQNIILTIANAPNLLGAAIMLNDGINIFSIIAIEECEVCLVDINILKSFILENGQLSLKLLEFLSGMFKDSIFNFISLAHKQVNGRIADVLIYLSKSIYQEDRFKLTVTRKEISEFAGCSQENVINTLSKFHKENIIKSEGKYIEIVDWNKLFRISQTG